MTEGGTRSETSTPDSSSSLTMLEEMKDISLPAMKKTISIDGSTYAFPAESWNSYSKSVTARRPLIRAFAPCYLAYLTVKPSEKSTSTFG